MAEYGKPYLGPSQPRTGYAIAVVFDSVARRSKKDKGPSLLRAHLAKNVAGLRDQHHRFRTFPTVTARNRELAKCADVSLSQVQRIVAQTLGVSIDIIEALATALDVRPQDLLTPYFVKPQSDSEDPPAREVRRR